MMAISDIASVKPRLAVPTSTSTTTPKLPTKRMPATAAAFLKSAQIITFSTMTNANATVLNLKAHAMIPTFTILSGALKNANVNAILKVINQRATSGTLASVHGHANHHPALQTNPTHNGTLIPVSADAAHPVFAVQTNSTTP